MLSEKMRQAYNDQINAEIYSAYLYYSMNAYFQSLNLPGFAHWMEIQALEELTHAQKFANFINERRGRVELAAIEKPTSDWKNPLTAFMEVFKHEQNVSERIYNLVKLAEEHKDYASINMLQWFVNEQVEEESAAEAIVQQLKLINGNGAGILMLDRELAARVFVPPTAPAA